MAPRDFYHQLARYSDVVFILPAAMGVGFGIGYLLDLWWGSWPWASLGLLFLGIVAGFYQVIKIVTGKED